MNPKNPCDRFEREGVLSLERGAPLDPHFSSCSPCLDARQKHQSILAALPFAVCAARAPIGWQARVLRHAAPTESRPGPRMAAPDALEAFGFLGVAAMLAAAFFGLVRGGPSDVDATADFHENGLPPVESTTPIGPDSDRSGLPEDEKDVTHSKAPAPIAPAPRIPRKEEPQPPRAAPEHAEPPALAERPQPALAGPDTAPMAPAPRAFATAHKVVRPDQLRGFHLDYPRAAMDARVQGETRVQCTVRADGRNTNCRILKSLPFLDEPILKALAAARSEPIKVDGKPVDNSDHIWNISIVLLEPPEQRMSARGIPIVSWKNSAP